MVTGEDNTEKIIPTVGSEVNFHAPEVSLPTLISIPVLAPVPIPVPIPLPIAEVIELTPSEFDQYNMNSFAPPRATDRIVDQSIQENKAWPSPEPVQYAKLTRSEKVVTDDIMDLIFGDKIAENADPEFTKVKWRPAPIFYLAVLGLVYLPILALLGYMFYENIAGLFPLLKTIFSVKNKEILSNLYSPVYAKAWIALATGMLFSLHAFAIHGLLRAKRLGMLISTGLLSLWSIGVADYLLHKHYPIGSFSFIIGWTGFIACLAIVLTSISKRMRQYAVRRILR